MNTRRPLARRDGLLERLVGDDLILYDLKGHRAHCLDPDAKFLLAHCDGTTDIPALATAMAQRWDDTVPEATALATVCLTLRRFEQAGLLEPSSLPRSSLMRIDRRQLLRLLALAPLITSIAIPDPVAAQTCLPFNAACVASSQCCSFCCSPSGKCKNNGACV